MCNLRVEASNSSWEENWKRGFIEGWKEGYKEGQREERKRFVTSLLQYHVDIEVIAKVAESPVEYVRQVAEEAQISCR